MLSSVECDTQYLYETAVFSGIKAFVLQLLSKILECYELTPSEPIFDPIESQITGFPCVTETSMYIFLSEPCAGCALIFQDERQALLHLSQSVCKKCL